MATHTLTPPTRKQTASTKTRRTRKTARQARRPVQRQAKRATAPARQATPTTRDARLAATLAALDPDDPRRVPCPSCGANAGAYCRRPSGHSGPLIQPHAARRAQLTGKAVPFPRPIATPFPPSVPERSEARHTTCERVKSPLPVPEPSPVSTTRNANGWDDPAIRARRVAAIRAALARKRGLPPDPDPDPAAPASACPRIRRPDPDDSANTARRQGEAGYTSPLPPNRPSTARVGLGTGRPARPRTARPGASRPDLSHSPVREAAVVPTLPDRPPENATPDERVEFYRRASLRLDVDFHLAFFQHTEAERDAFLALRTEAERVERRGRQVPKPLRREYFRLIDAVVHRRILEERASRPAVEAAVWTPIDQTQPAGHQGWASERAGRATVPAVPPVESADDEDAEAVAA